MVLSMVDDRTGADRSDCGRGYVLLYDGECAFCRAGSLRLVRLAPPGAVRRVDMHQPGVLDRCGVDAEACGRAMHLVAPDGRVYAGAEAVAATLSIRSGMRLVLWVYRLPGVRQACDAAYGWVARNRYRLMGVARDPCEGACKAEQR